MAIRLLSSESIDGALTIGGALTGTSATFAGSIGVGGIAASGGYMVDITPSGGNIIRSTRGTSVFGSYQSNNSDVYLGTISSNTFKIITNDTTAITIDNSQNATFAGEVSLKSRLNLQRSSGGATTLIQFKNEIGVDRAHIDFGGTNEELSFFAGSGSSEHMRIDSSGKLGVANTNPSAFNSLGATAQIVIGDSSSFVSNLTMYSSSTGYGSLSFADSNSSSSSSQYSGLIQYYHTDNSMTFYTSATPKMRIESSGNIGIGTTSPLFKLQTNATITGNWLGYLNGTSATFGTNNFSAVHSSTAIGTGTESGINLANNASDDGAPSPIISFSAKSASGSYQHAYAAIYGIKTATGVDTNWTKGDIVLATGSGTGPNERMRIDSSGSTTITTDGVVDATTLTLTQTGGIAIDEALGYLNFYSNDPSTSSTGGVGGIAVRAETTYNTSHTPSYMSFYTHDTTTNDGTVRGNVTERMRINSAGFLKASNNGSYDNATSTVHELVSNSNGGQIAKFTHKGTVPYGMQIRYSQVSPNITDNYFFIGSDSTANRIIIWGNGNVQNQNNSYGALSDIKLKENIVDATPKLDDLMKVKIRNFNLIGDDNKQIGVIAQEIEEVFPSLVEDVKEQESEETTKSVKYSVLVPIMLKAIQELKAEIELLKNK